MNSENLVPFVQVDPEPTPEPTAAKPKTSGSKNRSRPSKNASSKRTENGNRQTNGTGKATKNRKKTGNPAAPKSWRRKSANSPSARKKVIKVQNGLTKITHAPHSIAVSSRASSQMQCYVLVPTLTEARQDLRRQLEVDTWARFATHADADGDAPHGSSSGLGHDRSVLDIGAAAAVPEEDAEQTARLRTPTSRLSARSSTSSSSSARSPPYLPPLIYPMPSTPTLHDNYLHTLTRHINFLSHGVHAMTASLLHHGFIPIAGPEPPPSPSSAYSNSTFATNDAANLLLQWSRTPAHAHPSSHIP